MSGLASSRQPCRKQQREWGTAAGCRLASVGWPLAAAARPAPALPKRSRHACGAPSPCQQQHDAPARAQAARWPRERRRRPLSAPPPARRCLPKQPWRSKPPAGHGRRASRSRRPGAGRRGCCCCCCCSTRRRRLPAEAARGHRRRRRRRRACGGERAAAEGGRRDAGVAQVSSRRGGRVVESWGTRAEAVQAGLQPANPAAAVASAHPGDGAAVMEGQRAGQARRRAGWRGARPRSSSRGQPGHR